MFSLSCNVWSSRAQSGCEHAHSFDVFHIDHSLHPLSRNRCNTYLQPVFTIRSARTQHVWCKESLNVVQLLIFVLSPFF
jgi:hypothetical protein